MYVKMYPTLIQINILSIYLYIYVHVLILFQPNKLCNMFEIDF